MDKLQALEFLQTEQAFWPVKLLKQHWTQSRFSYLETPRPDHGLMLLLRGGMEFAAEGQLLSAGAGDVIYLPKGCHYEVRFCRESGAVENYLVNFDSEHPVFPAAPVRLLENASPACADRFRELIEEKYAADHSVLRSKGLLYLLLDAVTGGEGPEPSVQRILAKAQALLQEDLPIPAIATACCISESGLRRLFRQRLGCSPAQYRIQSKLRQATYLLESTEMTVGEIADELGFFDTAYFCKLFRAHLGVTPKQYAGNKKL